MFFPHALGVMGGTGQWDAAAPVGQPVNGLVGVV